MPTLVIKAVKVTQPAAGKVAGRITDENNNTYGFFPNKLSPVQGKSYELTYALSSDGKWKNAVELVETRASVDAAAGPAAPSGAIDTSCSIFVTGVIGRAFHGTGIVPDQAALTLYVRNCVAAWRAGTTDESPY